MFITSAFRFRISIHAFSFIIVLLAMIFFGFPGILSASPAEEEELYLTILHTNDEHSALIPHSSTVDFHPEKENPTIGGYGRIASAVNEIRAIKETTDEPVLLLSAGDYIGGSAFSWLIPAGFAPELEIKQIIGYDAVVIGNHEYDYGPDILANYYIEEGYPEAHEKTMVIASNTVAPPDHPLAEQDLYRESALIVLDNGLKVGLFGLIGKQAISYTTANEPVEFTDQHETARRMVEQLRGDGAQLIIAITHSRVEEDIDLARDVPGIDIIIGGHCHTSLYEPIIENDTVIVQTGSLLEYLGQVELAYNLQTGEIRLRNEENNQPYLLKMDSTIPLDPAVTEVIETYTAELNTLIETKTGGLFDNILETVAYADFEIPNYPPLQESPFGNFVTDAMRLITWEKTGYRADFAIQANGAIRGSVIPGSMPESFGQVSAYDLAELVGLGIGPDGSAGYAIVAAYLTGEEIYRALEVAALLSEMMGDTYFLQFSGLRYDYNPQNAVLFTVPFLDLPIPTTRAVTSAERYSGEGRQGDDEDLYIPLERGDEELYCLITDTYIVSFLPMVGEILPQLDIILKDREGNPVPDDELDRLVVSVDGQELKVWATVLEYAARQPIGPTGLPEIDAYYASTAGRINPVWTVPLITWPILIILILVVLIVLLVRRRRLRKLKSGA
jgi:5'-nucleotidase / UDP-sugar diphosphatase